MFAAEFEPAGRNGRRKAPRAAVALDAEFDRGGLGRTLCKVVDVSLGGVRLSTYSALARGTTIWLTLPHVGQVAVDVMWADDFTAGCQFRKALTPQQLESVLDAART